MPKRREKVYVFIFRTIHTRRGWIKRIRFAPGRGNTKFGVLYLDGMDIFELKEGKVSTEIVLSLQTICCYE